MNPEYLMIAGSMWKLLRKRTALWYLHKTVSWRLRLGVLFADHVFTASEKSMRLKTKKKRIVGHGIDSSSIALVGAPAYPPLHLLSVGRISRVKRTHLLIETLALLLRDGIEATLTIVGAPATKDGKKYEHELHEQAEGLGARARVLFMGPVQHAELGGLFEGAHLFLHASGTGSLDKASLEPLLAGVPIITVDDELASAELPGIILATPDAEAFAGAVRKALGTRLWDDATVREASRAYVMEHHELERLVPRMLAIVNS
jgi:glycosyltransferase involved in cell wall biosynthesis